MDIEQWKKEIQDHYNYLQVELRNIKQDALFKHLQQQANYCNYIGDTREAAILYDVIENHFNLSDIYQQFNWLHGERLAWLEAFTDYKHIKDNEYFRNMAYKFIHENTVVAGLQLIMAYNSLPTGSLEYV